MKPLAVLIRLDKIGDLVSTLPVDELIPLQDFDCQWVLSKGLGFIPDHALPIRKYLELDRRQKWQSFVKLFQFLKEKKPSLAISFQAPWWVSVALWLSRVPLRVGVRSQWHSLIFFNKSLRQRRSRADRPEADYNRDLVYYGLASNPQVSSEIPTPILRLKSREEDHIKQNYVVVHPGMAGSALNWRIRRFIDLIDQLKQSSLVVITGTLADEPWLIEIKKTFMGDSQVQILQNSLSGPELLTVLEKARAVIAPSTGVLHLAASLGTPTLGIYSPVRVQRALRWGARGPRVKILSPEVECPASFNCLESRCKEFYCMDLIHVDSVLKELNHVAPML